MKYLAVRDSTHQLLKLAAAKQKISMVELLDRISQAMK